MLLGRERMLMAFVARAPSSITKLKLVKWLFVAAKEHNAGELLPFYDFLPYQYGPFSFTAYHELSRLAARGFLSEGEKSVEVLARRKVAEAIDRLPPAVSKVVDDVLREYGKLGEGAIVDRVYARHPWFATRSKLRPAEPARKAPRAVYTCGYEGASIDRFLNRLLEKGIEQVIDVRKNAYSRKYGFTGGVFRSLCEKAGIAYAHVPELGVPSDLRTDLSTREARDALFALYRKDIVPAQANAQERVVELVKERASALLCFEAEAQDCHRGTLAPFISRRAGLPITHL